jgi:hypothetical protein
MREDIAEASKPVWGDCLRNARHLLRASRRLGHSVSDFRNSERCRHATLTHKQPERIAKATNLRLSGFDMTPFVQP